MNANQEHKLNELLESYVFSYGIQDNGECTEAIKEDLYTLISEMEDDAFAEGVSFANRISGG